MQIGIDIQDVETLKRFIGTSKMERIFTKHELDYFAQKNNNLETITGIYCAKEAFFKALGSGLKIKQLLDVEVKHTQDGAPFYELSSNIVMEHRLCNAKISLSISHTKQIAVAVCVVVKIDMLLD